MTGITLSKLKGPAIAWGMSMLCAGATTPELVPWPAAVTVEAGAFVLGPDTRIVPGGSGLAPLAEVLAGEIGQVFGQTLGIDGSAPAGGNIRLQVAGDLSGEQYRLSVGAGGVLAEAGNYPALAAATVSLLQLIEEGGEGQLTIPCMTINDSPAVAYRGLMIDVARQAHSVATLKQIIQLCRLYKIRYLQLHLTDDQGFMFPSTAFPLLSTDNHSGPAYTLAELGELEQYSQQRGVTIIPELEIPGHAAAMNRTMPDLFKIKDTLPYEHHATINWARQEVMDALDVLIGEICAVFPATPYFHVGGDEADFVFAHQNEHFIARFRELGYAEPFDHGDSYQLYRRLLRTLSESIETRHGKQMLCWEGFHRDQAAAPLEPVPKTIPVMAFENTYYPADLLVADGYPVINSAWNPLYVVNGVQCSPEHIYGWNIRQFGRYQADWNLVQWVTVPAGSNVIGAQMCAWEQPQELELPSLRQRLAAMSERIWNPDAGKSFADFSARMAATDELLGRLTATVEPPDLIDVSGSITNPNSEIGAGKTANLTGDTSFGWQTGSCAIPVLTNGHRLTLDSGNGNPYNYSGEISGGGGLELLGASSWAGTWNVPIQLGGSTGNSYAGPTLVARGTVRLEKTTGDALRGAITVGRAADGGARLVWAADNQLGDASQVTLVFFDDPANQPGGGDTFLDLDGHRDTIAALSLGQGTFVNTGAGGVLTLGSLTVAGQSLAPGSYTAANSDFVSGSGSLVVAVPPPPVPKVNALTVDPVSGATVRFDAMAGIRYRIRYADDLQGPPATWSVVTPPPDGWITAPGDGPMSMVDPGAGSTPRRFYVVEATNPPDPG